MKNSWISLSFTLALLLVGAGCGSLDLAADGKIERVIRGSVRTDTALPEGTEILVRLLGTPMADGTLRTMSTGMPGGARAPAREGEIVLGQHLQVLARGTLEPVPFEIQFSAEDAVVRRGLNVEVRISYGGRLRYRTVNAHVVTLASSAYPQTITVQSVER